MTEKLLVIGFDGMTWDVVSHADMPNLQAIIDAGGQGNMTSTMPPVTCPAWPSFLTGEKPYNHGLYDFAYLNSDNEIALNHYQDIETATLIDVMDDQNVPSIFFEIPLTYPAPKTNPLVIGGYPANKLNRKFSHDHLHRTLREEIGEFPSISPTNPTKYLGRNREDTIRTITDLARYRGRAFRHLLESETWEFATINLHIPDQMGHYFWEEFEENPFDNPLTTAYETADDILGDFLESVDDNTDVIVMSDHGHGRQTRTINLNYYLLKQGFLRLKSGVLTSLKKTLSKWGITPGNVKSLVEGSGLGGLIPKMSRKRRDQLLDKFLNYRDIDWERSEAFAFGHIGQVYWIGDDPSRLKALRSDLLELSINGQPVVTDIIPLRKSKTSTEPSKTEPIWLLNMNEWSTLSYPFLMSDWTLSQQATQSGAHRPTGVLAWSGPNCSRIDETIEADIMDLAPTIHRLLGLPPKQSFDGQTIEKILGPSAPGSSAPVQFTQSNSRNVPDDEEDRMNQLKNQGYL